VLKENTPGGVQRNATKLNSSHMNVTSRVQQPEENPQTKYSGRVKFKFRSVCVCI